MKEIVLENKVQDEAEKVADMFRQALSCTPEEFGKRYREFKEAKARFDEVYEGFKENIVKLHATEKDLPKSLVVDSVKLTYVAPSVRTTIDSKKLKEEEPELAKKFSKTSNVSATVRIEGI